jgi:hypothetical protein
LRLDFKKAEIVDELENVASHVAYEQINVGRILFILWNFFSSSYVDFFV